MDSSWRLQIESLDEVFPELLFTLETTLKSELFHVLLHLTS